LNLRPSGYEPDELPGCSTPRHHVVREFRLICADAFMPRANWCVRLLSRRDMRLSSPRCVEVRRSQDRPRKTSIVAAPPL
jgi:hypothetical protein